MARPPGSSHIPSTARGGAGAQRSAQRAARAHQNIGQPLHAPGGRPLGPIAMGQVSRPPRRGRAASGPQERTGELPQPARPLPRCLPCRCLPAAQQRDRCDLRRSARPAPLPLPTATAAAAAPVCRMLASLLSRLARCCPCGPGRAARQQGQQGQQAEEEHEQEAEEEQPQHPCGGGPPPWHLAPAAAAQALPAGEEGALCCWAACLLRALRSRVGACWGACAGLARPSCLPHVFPQARRRCPPASPPAAHRCCRFREQTPRPLSAR